jgi:hypothetical protein
MLTFQESRKVRIRAETTGTIQTDAQGVRFLR